MGWTTCYHAKHWKNGKVDRRLECDDMLTWEEHDEQYNVRRRVRVLKSAMVGTTYYAAVENSNPQSGKRHVFAAIFLTCGKSPDGTIWGYKDMDETEGPNQSTCPESILNLLTPIDSKWANEWRERCRANIAKKAANKGKVVRPPEGVEIKRCAGGMALITSAEYRAQSAYNAIWVRGDKERALKNFLDMYGTEAQKREFAETPYEKKVRKPVEKVDLPEGYTMTYKGHTRWGGKWEIAKMGDEWVHFYYGSKKEAWEQYAKREGLAA